MPTYEYSCAQCGNRIDLFRSISDYVANPNPVFHCGKPMERFFSYEASRAIDNPLAGDRMYAGLRTTDGVDVSTRTKHRAYMKERGLTTADDYRDEWKRAAEERARIREGVDPARRADVERAFARVLNR